MTLGLIHVPVFFSFPLFLIVSFGYWVEGVLQTSVAAAGIFFNIASSLVLASKEMRNRWANIYSTIFYSALKHLKNKRDKTIRVVRVCLQFQFTFDRVGRLRHVLSDILHRRKRQKKLLGGHRTARAHVPVLPLSVAYDSHVGLGFHDCGNRYGEIRGGTLSSGLQSGIHSHIQYYT